MPAIEREAQAAETSHPKDLEVLGDKISLRNNINIHYMKVGCSSLRNCTINTYSPYSKS